MTEDSSEALKRKARCAPSGPTSYHRRSLEKRKTLQLQAPRAYTRKKASTTHDGFGEEEHVRRRCPEPRHPGGQTQDRRGRAYAGGEGDPSRFRQVLRGGAEPQLQDRGRQEPGQPRPR